MKVINKTVLAVVTAGLFLGAVDVHAGKATQKTSGGTRKSLRIAESRAASVAPSRASSETPKKTVTFALASRSASAERSREASVSPSVPPTGGVKKTKNRFREYSNSIKAQLSELSPKQIAVVLGLVVVAGGVLIVGGLAYSNHFAALAAEEAAALAAAALAAEEAAALAAAALAAEEAAALAAEESATFGASIGAVVDFANEQVAALGAFVRNVGGY